MLRLSRSNPRKKYEIDIKCDCEHPEKSGECMKDMTLRRAVNSKPPNGKLSPPNLTGTPNPVFYRLCGAREITTIKFQQVIPILKRFKQPPPYARQNLSSAGGTGSTLRRADQVFF